MPIRVKALLFAGRPNPQWTIPDREAFPLLKEIAETPGMLITGSNYPWCLHYNGLEVSILSDAVATEFGLPATFFIHTGHTRFETKAQELADRLVSLMFSGEATADSWVEGSGSASVLQEILFEAVRAAQPKVSQGSTFVSRQLEERTETARRAEGEALPRGKCIFDFTPYNPAFWNDGSTVQHSNNCYCYATDRRIDKFGYPGSAAGTPAPMPWTVANVTRAILADGAHRFDDCLPDSQKPRWLFALVIAEFKPGDPNWNDFHFFRGVVKSLNQPNEFWAHKPGQWPVMNTDCQNNMIVNLERADRGKYTQFGGYFCAPASMRIAGHP